MAMPPSLGDSDDIKVDYRLIREEHPIPPGNRSALLAGIERVLKLGGVQRLLLQFGKPIQVHRLVRANELDGNAPVEAVEDELLSAARNNEMAELIVSGDLDAYRTLYEAFQVLAGKKLKPVRLYVTNYVRLRRWLNLQELTDVSSVFGVSTEMSKDIPIDAVILVGVSYDEDPASAVGLRIPVDIKSINKEKSK